MFGLVRLVIMAVILTCLVLVSKRVGVDKPARVKRIALSTVLALIVGMLTTIYPIEDAILSFSSPQDVFKYTMRGKVEHIIDGQSSSMVFGMRSGENIQYHVIPKSKGGVNDWNNIRLAHRSCNAKKSTAPWSKI